MLGSPPPEGGAESAVAASLAQEASFALSIDESEAVPDEAARAEAEGVVPLAALPLPLMLQRIREALGEGPISSRRNTTPSRRHSHGAYAKVVSPVAAYIHHQGAAPGGSRGSPLRASTPAAIHTCAAEGGSRGSPLRASTPAALWSHGTAVASKRSPLPDPEVSDEEEEEGGFSPPPHMGHGGPMDYAEVSAKGRRPLSLRQSATSSTAFPSASLSYSRRPQRSPVSAGRASLPTWRPGGSLAPLGHFPDKDIYGKPTAVAAAAAATASPRSSISARCSPRMAPGSGGSLASRVHALLLSEGEGGGPPSSATGTTQPTSPGNSRLTGGKVWGPRRPATGLTSVPQPPLSGDGLPPGESIFRVATVAPDSGRAPPSSPPSSPAGWAAEPTSGDMALTRLKEHQGRTSGSPRSPGRGSPLPPPPLPKAVAVPLGQGGVAASCVSIKELLRGGRPAVSPPASPAALRLHVIKHTQQQASYAAMAAASKAWVADQSPARSFGPRPVSPVSAGLCPRPVSPASARHGSRPVSPASVGPAPMSPASAGLASITTAGKTAAVGGIRSNPGLMLQVSSSQHRGNLDLWFEGNPHHCLDRRVHVTHVTTMKVCLYP